MINYTNMLYHGDGIEFNYSESFKYYTFWAEKRNKNLLGQNEQLKNQLTQQSTMNIIKEA